MEKLPGNEMPPFIVTHRSPTAETRAIVANDGSSVRFELWQRAADPEPVQVDRDTLRALARIVGLPKRGA